jgi:TRAP-type mannitol/chloroaromatic compound transport system permease small subunit
MEMFLALIITNICLVGAAFVTNENNADMLLAGYNTMSKKEKESFDLKNYLIFFKKFFINLAIYSSLIYLTSYIVFEQSTAALIYFCSILIPLPYIIYKGNKFKIKN